MRIRFKLEQAAFMLVLGLLGILPRRVVGGIAQAFGLFAYAVDRRHRKVAEENLAIAFPEKSAGQRRLILRRCYSYFSRYLFDILLCLVRGFEKQFSGRFEVAGIEHLREAYQHGKGAIFFTAHYGAWELNAMAHGALGFPMGVIARPLDNPYLEKLLTLARTGTGNWVIDKMKAFRPTLKALKEGKGIAILIDQNVTTDERIFVDFFGKPASTTPALALLKLKTDARLIPVFSRPMPGNRYHFSYGPPVDVDLSGDRAEDVKRITQTCTRVIEEVIREAPEYWLWMHRRWKTRPEEELPGKQQV